MNHINLTGGGTNRQYISPLAEEIVVSFEECILSNNGLSSPVYGGVKQAGGLEEGEEVDI